MNASPNYGKSAETAGRPLGMEELQERRRADFLSVERMIGDFIQSIGMEFAIIHKIMKRVLPKEE